MTPPISLKILIVDDDRGTRVLMRTFLSRLRYKVFEAGDGQEAVEAFEREAPDIIIMDVSMPGMSGYEAAAIIKRQSAHRFVPIIFLTGLSDDDALVKCVESGGDDFMSKPFNALLLQAKLHAMLRIRELYGRLQEYQRKTEEDLRLARHVLERLTRRVKTSIPGLNSWVHAAGNLSGDLVLCDQAPSGRIYAMLGDFTGHGYAAAVGAMPVADIFYAMTAKDLGLQEIIREINRKLHEILPTGHFCAAGLVCYEPDENRLHLWNGGLPEILLVDAQGALRQRFPSNSFAFGVVGNEQFEIEVQALASPAESSVLIYSDGLQEAPNRQGVMFDEDGMMKAMASRKGASLFDAIKASVSAHLGERQAPDDISLLELRIL